MRKLMMVLMAVALISVTAMDVRAEDSSDLEISGNVTAVTGWQRPSNNAGLTNDGILGDGLDIANAGVGSEDFGFYLDQVEVDLAKSFGENIRIRADIDFTTNRTVAQDLGATGAIEVEQGYVTANIPAGNGVELLVGKFNSGIGLDPIDRNELSTVSFSSVHRTLLPHNLTGLRLGYDSSEATRFEFFIVNNLADHVPGGVVAGAATDTTIPSGGFNVSHAWGDEGNKSWVKLNGAVGPEVGTKKGISFLADLSTSLAVSDAASVGIEAVYRQDNPTGTTEDAQFVGGQLKGRYSFSERWDGTLRYGFVWDLDSSDVGVGLLPDANHLLVNGGGTTGLGANGTAHTVTLATGYQITDGARFVLEGSVDVGVPSAAGAGTGYTPGLAGMFAYSF